VAGSPVVDSRDGLDYSRATAVQQLPHEAGRGYETCPDCPRIHSLELVLRRLEFRQVHFLYASAVLVAHHDRGGQCYVLYTEYKGVPVGTAVFKHQQEQKPINRERGMEFRSYRITGHMLSNIKV
jgi:hypothetical protein